jgi:23S rRNA pseudouridine1911/1915/1917 synthase
MPEKPSPMQSEVKRARPEPEPLNLVVVYEDEAVIAIDKPAGMVVHPTYKNWTGTLVNGLLWRLRDRPGVLPHIVTRLDKDTSGLVVVALSPMVHAQVQRDATAGRMSKEYFAIVCGVPEPRSGEIALPLARSLVDRRRVVVTPAGQASKTRYEVVSTAEGLSLVRCELVTGRTHQIRVHLAALGWPIIGDAKYGAVHAGVARQALHACRVRMPHPISREPLRFDAATPPDLGLLLAAFAQPVYDPRLWR